jgi:endoglucanase
VGDGNLDHSYWGAPEALTMPRPAFAITPDKPGSDLAAEAAAALASASIIFRSTDAAYADTLLTNAQQLYTFADTYRGNYSSSIPGSSQFYNSWSGYQDELAWGAIWLHEAHQAKGSPNSEYLAKAKAAYQGLDNSWTQSWDNKSYGVAIMLAQETNESRYRADVETWLNNWLPGGSISYTDGGLAWLTQWGSLRYAANTAFLAGVYADRVHNPDGKYGDFASSQINYILGDNPREFSYMVGFGDHYPLNPHHRAASSTTTINDPSPNDHILYGGLVGGLSSANDFAYEDSRSNYITNEVALDYNAAFTGALARMVSLYGGVPLSNQELNALPGIVVMDLG